MGQIVNSDQRILVVTPTKNRELTCLAPLRDTGCRVELATDVDEAVRMTDLMRPTMVLVDDALQSLSTNALELSLRIRSVVSEHESPLIIVVAPTTKDGSDDAVEETREIGDGMIGMLEHVSDMLKNDASFLPSVDEDGIGQPHVLECDGVRLDRRRHRAWRNEAELQLTPTEFNLLWKLIERPGHVLSRKDLASACKGSGRASVNTRTIDAHVKSIRRKLGEGSALIETVHGVGYRFREE